MALNEQASEDLARQDFKSSIQKLKYAEQVLIQNSASEAGQEPWLVRLLLLTLNNLALNFKQYNMVTRGAESITWR